MDANSIHNIDTATDTLTSASKLADTPLISFPCAIWASNISYEQFVADIRKVLSLMSAHLASVDDSAMDKLIAGALEDRQRRKPVTREELIEELHRRRDNVYNPMEQCAIIADPPAEGEEPVLVGAGIISIGKQDERDKYPPLMFSVYPSKRYSRIRTTKHYDNTISPGVMFYTISSYMEWLHLDDGDGCHASVQSHSLPWGVHEYARMLGQEMAQGECDDAFSQNAHGLLWYCKCESWTKEFLHQVNDYVFFVESDIPRVQSICDMTNGLIADVLYEDRHDEDACRYAYLELDLLSPIWRSIANRASAAGETASVPDTFVKYGGPEMLQAAKDGVPIEDVIA